MSYNYPEIKNFAGLHLQANSFTVPDGALEVADNVVISKDGIVSKRRGFYKYYDPTTDTLNALVVYQDKLLAIFSDKIGYFTDSGSSPNYTGTRTTLSGATVAVTAPRVSRTVLANKNLYATSDNGVLKLDAYNGSVYKSGVPQALDLRGQLYGNSGVISSGKMVGWRLIFGRRDANDNLLLGAPSEVFTLTNSAVSATYTSTGAGPYTVTVTTSSPHKLTTGATIVTSGAVDTDANGTFSITVTTTTAFTYSTVGDPGSGSITYAVSRNARLEFSLPSEITTANDGYFYRLYRSSQVADSSTSIFSDFKLIDEKTLTSAEITAGVAFYNDDVNDILLGEELYTNQNSREGESQANYRAPKCDDMALFNGHVIYAACSTRHSLDLNVVDTSVLATGDYVEMKVDTTTRRYVARTGVGNQTVLGACSNSGGDLLITYSAHGLANDDSVYISNIAGGTLTTGTYYVVSRAANSFKISATIAGTAVAYNSETALDFQGIRTKETAVTGVAWVRASNVVTVTSTTHGLSTGMQVYVTNSAGGSPNVTSGLYTITVTGANAFTFAETAANDASGNTLDYAPYQPQFAMDASSSASVQLSTTARGLVKAVNRDSSALVYAAYKSGITDIPGIMNFQGKGFTGAIYMRANTTTAGTAFSPVLPSSFSSGTQVYSRNDQLGSSFFSSKSGEPEAVPIANQFQVGAGNKDILRALALRDSVILLKEDGVYRLTGDNVFNFSTTPVDTTVICVAPSSAVVLNNQVFCLTNQGVCLITESSVQIVSRKIEDMIQPILGSADLSTQTGAFAYESERIYGLTTLLPNGTSAEQSYIYNFLNDTWVTWDKLFKSAISGPGDVLYAIGSDDTICKERKNQTGIDFCGQNYDTTVVSVASGALSAVITSAAVSPQVDDVLVKSNVFNRITAVEATGSDYTVTFERACNLSAADTPILYQKYDSEIKTAPFHAGLVGRSKQFAQMQLHFRTNSVTKLSIVFGGDTYGSSETTTWSSILISAGFGNFPWGFEAWGQDSNVNIQRQTAPAPICRILVPRFQQRGTFIQPDITHSRAGEALNLQAISFAVRAYNERVSR